MKQMQVVETRGMRVLTTKQIAEAYETDVNTLSHNFRRNKEKYILGKHYIEIKGDELRELKSTGQFVHSLKQVKHLYLWTERGALLHAKSLNTDKAWEVYDYLVEFYFRVKEEIKPSSNPPVRKVVDVPENPKILNAIQKIKDDLTCMDVLLSDCIKYSEEETYYVKRRAASEVVNILIGDWSKLLEIKPKLIEKLY